MMSTIKILVTGATGQQGGALARLLLKRGHSVRAITRNPTSENASRLQHSGAELFKGDFNDPASLKKAALGMDAVFAMGTPYEEGPEAEIRHGINITNATKEADVPYLLYNSISDTDRKTGIPHFDSKHKIERHIASLGVPYTIVAPVYFFENFLSPLILPYLQQGHVAMGISPNTKLQSIAVANIASFDTFVLENKDKFLGTRINIASDELSGKEYAEVIARASGKRIGYFQNPLEEIRKFSEDLALMEEWFEKVGYSVDIDALRRKYPEVGWMRFEEWANSQDWRVLDRKTA
jgi:uncharacterized protein YbjT (DUF2867 family)